MMCVQNKETFKPILLSSGMVLCLFLAGCRDKSVDQHNQAVDHYNQGLDYYYKGDHDRAISEFTKAIEINPRFAMAYNNRGREYLRKGEHDLAISDFTKAIEIKPNDAGAYLNRAAAYYKKGQHDLAISDFNKAIEINPNNARAYSDRGIAYYHKEEYDKAWEDVHKAQSLGMQVPPAVLNALRKASGRQRSVGYAIENITATASSNEVGKGPENTVSGSGLDANDRHSNKERDMWLSSTEPLGAWVEYQFDKAYKLHEMWVWNSNQTLEPLLGFGLKDVTIEYSTNGTDYTTLGSTHKFARAPGAGGYAHNTTIDFGGAAAKYVRLTANSNWGGFLNQYGLSEVRFFFIPLNATQPYPDSAGFKRSNEPTWMAPELNIWLRDSASRRDLPCKSNKIIVKPNIGLINHST